MLHIGSEPKGWKFSAVVRFAGPSLRLGAMSLSNGATHPKDNIGWIDQRNQTNSTYVSCEQAPLPPIAYDLLPMTLLY